LRTRTEALITNSSRQVSLVHRCGAFSCGTLDVCA